MSLKTQKFYAIRCDYPECGEVHDDGEFTFWEDPYYNSDTARDDGWYIGSGPDGKDYCPTHVIKPPSDDEVEDDDDNWGVKPREESIAGQVAAALARIHERIEQRADAALRRLRADSAREREDVRRHYASVARRKTRDLIEADPELLHLKPFYDHYNERLAQLQRDGQEQFGRPW